MFVTVLPAFLLRGFGFVAWAAFGVLHRAADVPFSVRLPPLRAVRDAFFS